MVIEERFFAIDVDSEIRSLCDSQLRGTWQMPAELVRFAVRSGAREIAVTSGWRGFCVSWKRGPIARATLENLAIALDGAAEASRRQESIATLESSGAEALLWAGGSADARLQIDGVVDGRQLRFKRRASRPPRLGLSVPTSSSDEVTVRWGCSKLDRRRAGLWLRMACRFSEVDVTMDGQPVARGFTDGLYRMRLEDPLHCVIGLTRHGEEPILWLLRDGIVAARAVLPGYPPFEAAVELGPVVSGAASSSDLRRAVTPYVSDLCERAVDMMIEVAGRPQSISGPEGQRLIALLLRAARRDLRREAIRSLRLLPNLGETHQLLSLTRLEALARWRGGRLFAVEPGEGADGVLADAASTIVASPEVRNLLVELTGIRFQPPPRRHIGVLRRMAGGARAITVRAIERGQGMLRPRILPPDSLTAGERRVLALLRAALSPRTVELGNGKSLRRTATGFIVPRLDSAVVAAVGRVGDDPAWLYPLVLALRLDVPSFGSLRKDWITRVENQPGKPPFSSRLAGQEPVDGS